MQNKGKVNIEAFLRLTELLTAWCCIQHGQTAPLKPEKNMKSEYVETTGWKHKDQSCKFHL